MIYEAETLHGYKMRCVDGDIGAVRDFYFDDEYWAVRYLVVDTGSWLSGRQVVVSPYALKDVIRDRGEISVALTMDQIESSPSPDSERPVSRQFEDEYFGFFGWPMYWNGPYMWGAYPNIARDRDTWTASTPPVKSWDPHLRSTKAVSGYHIEARDGEIGHIVDFLIDSDTWAIRYLIASTQNWWPGKKVLLAPRWISRVSWDESKLHVDLTREEVKRSPAYPIRADADA